MAERAVGRALRARDGGGLRRRARRRREVLAVDVSTQARRSTYLSKRCDAERGILTQLIAFGWRYSIGNPYEELSYAESLDAAEVAAEYGYSSVAKSIIEFSLDRMRVRPWRFTAFRGGHILSTAATYYRLTRDRSFLRAETPALDGLVKRIAARQLHSGPARGRLLPEPLSTDLENHNVDSVSGQIEAVTGLRAIGRVWRSNGYPAHAARARALALSIDRSLRPAVARASARLHDGSLFVPDQLTTRQRPFDRLTATRDGSYWNLVMPYAFASGWFPAHSRAARGILQLSPGARLATPRRAAHLRAHGLRGSARRRARSGLRPQHLEVPRRKRPARSARPEPLRHARRGDDARHVRLGRGGVGAACERRSRPRRCSCRRTRARTPRISRRCASCSFTSAADRSAPRPGSTWRSRRRAVARGRPDRSTCATRRRASARCPTRSSGTARRSKGASSCRSARCRLRLRLPAGEHLRARAGRLDAGCRRPRRDDRPRWPPRHRRDPCHRGEVKQRGHPRLGV